MLRSINEILGYSIKAGDEDVGKVENFYFDDERWTIRYLVADTGGWLPGKRVLISTAGFYEKPDWENKKFFVVFKNKEQVKGCPDIMSDRPISRQRELEYIKYFSWPVYWELDTQKAVTPLMVSPKTNKKIDEEENTHLRSVNEVIGYRVHAKDGEIGHIDDFVIDDNKWEIQFIVVSTKDILSGKKVLIPIMWAKKVSWEDAQIDFALTKKNIEKSPLYDPSAPVSRDHEGRLYDYYGRPKLEESKK